jgi:hypothetical protein
MTKISKKMQNFLKNLKLFFITSFQKFLKLLDDFLLSTIDSYCFDDFFIVFSNFFLSVRCFFLYTTFFYFSVIVHLIILIIIWKLLLFLYGIL